MVNTNTVTSLCLFIYLFIFEPESNCDVQSGLQCLHFWSSASQDMGLQADEDILNLCQILSSVFNASFFMALKSENPHCRYFTLRWTDSILSVPHKNRNSKRRKRMLHYRNKVMTFSSQAYITNISKASFLDLTGKKRRNGTSLGISEFLLCTLVKGFQSDLPSRNSLSTSLRN